MKTNGQLDMFGKKPDDLPLFSGTAQPAHLSEFSPTVEPRQARMFQPWDFASTTPPPDHDEAATNEVATVCANCGTDLQPGEGVGCCNDHGYYCELCQEL